MICHKMVIKLILFIKYISCDRYHIMSDFKKFIKKIYKPNPYWILILPCPVYISAAAMIYLDIPQKNTKKY